MRDSIQTVLGPIPVSALGPTLMHEHLTCEFAGWQLDPNLSAPTRREMVATCVDRIEELKAAGFRSLLDPCPNDLGRDVELMGEVAAKTGFNIVFSTGLYHEAWGANAYWVLRRHRDPDCAKTLADAFMRELDRGIGNSGARAGVIKVATSGPAITDYERMVFEAAASASRSTGAPITTHTDAILGLEQQALLASLGVPAHRIVIGHCCGSPDHDYHAKLVEGGTYLGFDRFGAAAIQSDEVRVGSLLALLRHGAASRVMISHDSVWCLRGDSRASISGGATSVFRSPLRFTREIAPRLQREGVLAETIRSMIVDNPRRYFADEPLPALA